VDSTSGSVSEDAGSEYGAGLGGGSPREDDLSSFVYLGRARAHRSAITGIEFGVRDGKEVLVSVAEDR